MIFNQTWHKESDFIKPPRTNKTIRIHTAEARKKNNKIKVIGDQYLDFIGRVYDEYDWYFVVVNPKNETIYDSRHDDIVMHKEHDRTGVYKLAQEWAMKNIK